jgi:hypothetical protein
MVKTQIVVNGENLLHNFISNGEILVYGNLKVGVFLRNDCTDLFYFVSPSEPQVDTVLFVGQNITVVFKSSTVVVISGDVEKFVMVNSKGNVVKTYKLNNCGEQFLFTEVKL